MPNRRFAAQFFSSLMLLLAATSVRAQSEKNSQTLGGACWSNTSPTARTSARAPTPPTSPITPGRPRCRSRWGGQTRFDGVTPTHSYKAAPPGWGAVELAGRISYLKLDDDTFPTYADDATTPREATGYGVALSWHPSRNARIAVHYERTDYDGAPSPTRTHEDALITRGQVTF
jgi:Phosphate-selective porin O and P